MADGAEDDRRAALRETYRKQLTASIGGWSGTVIAGLPTVVFVVVNSISGLRPGIFAAVGSAGLLALYRLVRKQSTQQVLTGLVGVLIAALIAARTGQARGYFLYGIWVSFIYAVPWAVSALVRRPLVGWLWEFVDPSPPDPDDPGRPWYRRPRLRRAYTIATVIAAGMFLARGVVQAVLYHDNATGWLAVAKIVMGTPLYLGCVAAGYWVVRRVRRDMAAHLRDELEDRDEERSPAVDPDPLRKRQDQPDGSVGDGAADRPFGLG